MGTCCRARVERTPSLSRQMLSGVSEASLAEVGLPLAPGHRAVLLIGAELGPGPDSPSRD